MRPEETTGRAAGRAAGKTTRRETGGDREISKLTHVDLHSPVNKLILRK